MSPQRFFRRLSAPFAALLVFGAVGILAMIVALTSTGPSPVARPLITQHSATPSPSSPSSASSTPSPPAPSDAAGRIPTPDGEAAVAPTTTPPVVLAPATTAGKHHHGDHQGD